MLFSFITRSIIEPAEAPMLDASIHDNPSTSRVGRKYFSFTTFTTLTTTQFAIDNATTVRVSIACFPQNGLLIPPCAK